MLRELMGHSSTRGNLQLDFLYRSRKQRVFCLVARQVERRRLSQKVLKSSDLISPSAWLIECFYERSLFTYFLNKTYGELAEVTMSTST